MTSLSKTEHKRYRVRCSFNFKFKIRPLCCQSCERIRANTTLDLIEGPVTSLEKEEGVAVAGAVVGGNIPQDHSKTADNSAKEYVGSTLGVIRGTKSVHGPTFELHGPYLPLPTPQPVVSSTYYVDSETRSSPASLSGEDWQQGQRVQNCSSTVSYQM